MELNIIDTGYLNINGTGTQLSAANRAGYDGSSSVNVIPLQNVMSSKFGGQSNFNDSPLIGTTERVPVSVNTSENEVINLSFAYKRDDIPPGTWHKSFAWQLNRLKKTKGVKALYQVGDGSFDTSLMQLGQYYTDGGLSPSFVPSATPYLPVQCIDVTFSDSPKSKYIKVNLTLKITE